MSVCRKGNILVSFLVDVGLGILLMSWLYRDDHIATLANMLMPAADVSYCSVEMFAVCKCEGPNFRS